MRMETIDFGTSVTDCDIKKALDKDFSSCLWPRSAYGCQLADFNIAYDSCRSSGGRLNSN